MYNISNVTISTSHHLNISTSHHLNYILYKSPAFMRRNLFTDIIEQIAVMKMPNTTTVPAVIASTSHVMRSSTCGSYMNSAYTPPPNTQQAMSAASKPSNT